MKRSNRLVILVGVLLAVLAFVAIIIVLNGNGNQTTPQALKVNVLVAKSNIAIGDAVTPDLVQVKQVSPDAVVPTRIDDPSQLTGHPALYAIPAGTQVTAEAVGLGPLGACVSCLLKPGEKAIALQVDRVTGLDFLLQRTSQLQMKGLFGLAFGIGGAVASVEKDDLFEERQSARVGLGQVFSNLRCSHRCP